VVGPHLSPPTHPPKWATHPPPALPVTLTEQTVSVHRTMYIHPITTEERERRSPRAHPRPRRGEGASEGGAEEARGRVGITPSRGATHPPVASALGRLDLDVVRERALPLVAVGEELLLVLEELLARLGRELEIRPLDDRVDGARLLAEAALDALRHVDVLASRLALVVAPHLRLDGDRLRGADGLAELAGDAALLARGLAAERVLAAEARRDGVLLKGVVDRHLRLHRHLRRESHAAEHVLEELALGEAVHGCPGESGERESRCGLRGGGKWA
jgi:hypothetical protein